MLTRSKLAIAYALLTLAAVAGGCSDARTVDQNADEIIGGFPARSPKLNAIGALGFAIPEETDAVDPLARFRRRPYVHADRRALAGDQYFPFCSAVLIAPDAVLTAEHCVAGLFGDEEFLIGFDGTQPDRTVKITGAIAETTLDGGFVGLGSDVAVAFLAERIDDIVPARVGVLGPDDVGSQYVGVGYGVRSNDEEAGQRYLGAMDLRGVGGNHALNVWDSYEIYLEHFPELGIDDDPQVVFDSMALLEQHEATFGAGPGNAQACFGDSGGPVARTIDGQLTVFGITSGGLSTIANVCDWGGVYSVFGPVALDFIDRALACGLVESETSCEGDTAVRCAPPAEGGYRVVRTDCSLIGLVCALDAPVTIPPSDVEANAGCIDDPCEGLAEGGRCDGDVFIRCSTPDEGARHTVEFDCAAFGGTCGVDDSGAAACLGLSFGSCEGNCGGAATDPEGNIVCFCDDLCTIFGDCCDDFEEFCPLPEPDPEPEPEPVQTSPIDDRAQR